MLLITHFNKLIRNKLIWGAFAILVCVSFVLVGYSTRGCGDVSDEAAGVEGTLYGESISSHEFMLARSFELGLRESRELTDEEQAALRKRTWMRLAALHKARTLGLMATDADVAHAIQRDPTFAEQGIFSPQRYRAIVENQLRMERGRFEEYVRQDLTLRRLSSVLGAMVWAAPAEVQDRLTDLTDVFTVEYAAITNRELVANLEVTDEELQTFYDENPDMFRTPEQVCVRYVRFPISNYLATANISEEAIQEYYTNRLDEYTSTSTNGTEFVTPIAEVHDTIAAKLKQEAAVNNAKDAATDFVTKVAPDQYGNAVDFDQVAHADKLAICTTEYFSVSEVLTNLNVGLDFNRAAFDLDKGDPNGYFSDAVAGDNDVYVMALNERRPSRLPPLDEVRGKVLAPAREAKEQKTFLAEAEKVRAAVELELTNETSFAQAVVSHGVSAVTSTPFTVYEWLGNTSLYGDIITRSVVGRVAGEVLEPKALERGALLIYVARRDQGDVATAESLRPQLAATLDRYRGGLLMDTWGEYLLREGHLDDRLNREGDSPPAEQATGSDSEKTS